MQEVQVDQTLFLCRIANHFIKIILKDHSLVGIGLPGAVVGSSSDLFLLMVLRYNYIYYVFF